jgi:hypothetical protein
VNWVLDGEPRLYRGKLIRCQSDHDDYAYSRGEVVMSSGDGMGSTTPVPVSWHAWAPKVTSYHVCIKWPRSPRDPALWSLARFQNPQVWLPGAWAHAEAGYKEDLDWGDGW